MARESKATQKLSHGGMKNQVKAGFGIGKLPVLTVGMMKWYTDGVVVNGG